MGKHWIIFLTFVVVASSAFMLTAVISKLIVYFSLASVESVKKWDEIHIHGGILGKFLKCILEQHHVIKIRMENPWMPFYLSSISGKEFVVSAV